MSESPITNNKENIDLTPFPWDAPDKNDFFKLLRLILKY